MKNLLICVLSVSLLSCNKKENEHLRKVTASEIETMVVFADQEYVTTIGIQSPSGPYEDHSSDIGGPGWSIQFENLKFTAPDDGRTYIARKFRNPDGSAFMKISRHPERTGRPQKGEQVADGDAEEAS